MDSSSEQHHHQEMSSQTLESMLVCTKSQQEKKPRPADMQALKCPRCDSTNTKFCYYNNYSLSQPRYFCKSCRRYWTKGGTLRNVPVGGGCRKNKRSSSSNSSTSTSSRRSQDHPSMSAVPSPIPCLTANPMSYDSNDLSLAIARLQKQASSGGQLGLDDHDFAMWANPNVPHHHVLGVNNASSFDLLRGGFIENPHHNLYNYGMGNGGLEMESGGGHLGMGGAQEMGIPFEDFSAVKEETSCVNGGGGRDQGGEGRVLWGFPWQSGMGGDGNGSDFDSSRLCWNGIGSTNWHGLLNSPLM